MNEKETNWNKGIEMQIKQGDRQGIDLRPFAQKGYDSNILKQIRCGKNAGIDLEEYVNRGFDGEQLREIKVAKIRKINLDVYLEEGFCGAQLRQIRKGMEHFVNVRAYAKTCYNWLQMREIRAGLENRIDVSYYVSPFFSHNQMKSIRMGLEDGIDVSDYADLMYSYTDMEQQRRLLTTRLYEEELPQSDITIEDESTGLEILLAENRMKAYITFPAEHRKVHFTVEYMEQILKKNGIVHGILTENIARAIAEKQFDTSVLVAEGTAPEAGSDATYQFLFNTEPSRKPVEMEDGRVDYKDVNIFEEVLENQPIARYIPPQKGINGKNVLGIEIPGRKGRELPVLKGNGFRLAKDGMTYVAAISGIIEYKDEEIHIYEALIIDEDVTAAYGNINFHGCVSINGNVGQNVEIMAEGSVIVEGTVEAAKIFSQSDVLIKNGMAGAGKGMIRAMGNIAGNFFESAELKAGQNIEAGYLMNSTSDAGGKVVMMGRRGAIIGGTTRGKFGIEANNIGNRSQIVTEVETGASQEVISGIQKCQEEYEKVEKELLELTTKMGQITGADRQSMPYKKLMNQRTRMREQAESIRKRRNKMQEILQTDNTVNVLSRAYAGTKITINQVPWILKEDYKMATFCLQGGRIVNK